MWIKWEKNPCVRTPWKEINHGHEVKNEVKLKKFVKKNNKYSVNEINNLINGV